MTAEEKELFLKVAYTLRMIDQKQFDAARKILSEKASEDSGRVLLEEGYITRDQYEEVASMIEEAKRKEGEGLEVYPDEPPSPEDEGTYSGNFELKKIIGQGGAGRVFLAFDRSIGREVALKEVLPAKLDKSRDYHLKRFIREAKISGRLQHPGVVPVYELTKKPDGTYFYVMKYVEGRTLFHTIMDCSEDESPQGAFGKRLKLLDRLIDVAEAMGYAHSNEIIHRDLKPSNVILGEFGETVILDWGLAKRLDERDEAAPPDPELTMDETTEGLTRHGTQLGTPSYMAPEQIDPDFGAVDASTDVYTLGVILFMILTGTKPYPGRGEAVMRLILESERPPSPHDIYEFVPPELAAICVKAMAREKKDRFQNASELAEELKAYRDGRLVSVYAYSRGELFKRFVARNKAAVIASALLILSIIVGAGFTTDFAFQAHKAKVKALNALEEVTSLSESAMILVRSKAQSVNQYFEKFEKELIVATGKASATGFGNRAALKGILKGVKEGHPEVRDVFIMDMKGQVITSYPGPVIVPRHIAEHELRYLKNELTPGDGDFSGLLTAEDGSKSFIMTVPIVKGGKLMGGLGTLMQVDVAVPAFLDFDPRKSPYQVWLMKDDGTIVYDEDEKQVGRNLFTDEMYKDFPELLKFGEQIRKKTWGIGHYSFIGKDGSATVYKVAAWDTLSSDGTKWKLVVTHQYASTK
jgi:serine/threonine protein kinase